MLGIFLYTCICVYACIHELPLKAGFAATILRRVAVTSSTLVFLKLFKNSVVMLSSYTVSKEPAEKFWGSSS